MRIIGCCYTIIDTILAFYFFCIFTDRYLVHAVFDRTTGPDRKIICIGELDFWKRSDSQVSPQRQSKKKNKGNNPFPFVSPPQASKMIQKKPNQGRENKDKHRTEDCGHQGNWRLISAGSNVKKAKTRIPKISNKRCVIKEDHPDDSGNEAQKYLQPEITQYPFHFSIAVINVRPNVSQGAECGG